MKGITIDQHNVDNALRMAGSSGGACDWLPTAISLGAAFEIAYWIAGRNSSANTAIEGWQDKNAYLGECLSLLRGGRVTPPQEVYTTRSHELFAVRNVTDLVGMCWNQFLERFSASLRQGGFGDLSHGIAGALDEMAGNIGQHSVFGRQGMMLNGVVGYSVGAGLMEFAVGDDGIGALESLRFNPHWNALASSRAALHAIAQQHASRRVGQGDGQGYRTLFRALASFDGVVRLRSGDGSFQLAGALGQCSPSGTNSPPIAGLQLSVRCRVKK
jgi:hypothetical protein